MDARTYTDVLREQMAHEPTQSEINWHAFERVYAPDGSYRLRRVGDGAWLSELDRFGRKKSEVA